MQKRAVIEETTTKAEMKNVMNRATQCCQLCSPITHIHAWEKQAHHTLHKLLLSSSGSGLAVTETPADWDKGSCVCPGERWLVGIVETEQVGKRPTNEGVVFIWFRYGRDRPRVKMILLLQWSVQC